jgi:hypothetical protein
VEKARALCNVNVGITGRVHVVSLVGIMLSDCVNRVNSA